MAQNDLISLPDAAQWAGVSENTIRYWVKTGRLPVAMTVGKRSRLFRPADVEQAAAGTDDRRAA